MFSVSFPTLCLSSHRRKLIISRRLPKPIPVCTCGRKSGPTTSTYENETRTFWQFDILFTPPGSRRSKMQRFTRPVLCLVLIFLGGIAARGDVQSRMLKNPCASHNSCSECIQQPKCAWCSKQVCTTSMY